jgi:hypothetical protein
LPGCLVTGLPRLTQASSKTENRKPKTENGQLTIDNR